MLTMYMQSIHSVFIFIEGSNQAIEMIFLQKKVNYVYAAVRDIQHIICFTDFVPIFKVYMTGNILSPS